MDVRSRDLSLQTSLSPSWPPALGLRTADPLGSAANNSLNANAKTEPHNVTPAYCHTRNLSKVLMF